MRECPGVSRGLAVYLKSVLFCWIEYLRLNNFQSSDLFSCSYRARKSTAEESISGKGHLLSSHAWRQKGRAEGRRMN